jgi:ADP-heptose:LPS heptosyltransferase
MILQSMESILVIRVGRVGDTVMMTPALKALIRIYPDAEFTLIVSPEGKRLLADYSHQINKIIAWDRHGPLAYLETRKLAAQLSRQKFNQIYCFDTNPRIAAITNNVSGELHWYRGSSTLKHCARHYLDLVAETNDTNIEDIPVNIPVSRSALEKTDQELASLGISRDDTVVMFHPTFSGYSRFFIRKRTAKKRKLWPASNYGELGHRLASSRLANGKSPKILIALLPDELSFGERIVSSSKGTITLLKSESGFERYKALLSRANLLVSPDSGPMHLGAAVNTSIIAFFSMKDPADCGPYMDPDRYTILRSEDSDRPEQGIASISVDTVYEACISQLNRPAADPENCLS